MPSRELYDQRSVDDEGIVLLHDEGADMSRRHTCKCSLEFRGSVNLGDVKRQSQAACGGIHLDELRFVNFIARIGEVADVSEARQCLLEHLQTLGHKFPIDRG